MWDFLKKCFARWFSWPTAEALERLDAERRQAEAALETERYFLHTLLDLLPEAIYFKDREGHFIRISKALATRLGLDCPSDALGKTDFIFFAQPYADKARSDEQELIRERRPLVAKEENPTWPNGTTQWVLTTKIPLVDRQGAVVGVCGISHDITRQKQTEQALRASEERFQLAVRGSSDGLWDWDITTDAVYYSPRFKELLGYEDHEMPNVFAAFESRLHPDDRAPTLAALVAHLEQRHPYDVEYRLLTRSGDYRWFRARGQAIWDAGGKATRMAGSLTDITDRKTAQLALHEAKEAAEAASRAKSNFLANVSHEIRTPMNAVIGLTELVLGTELPALQRDYLQTVLDSAESLLAVINQILDFSKIEAGKMELDVGPFSLREELGDAMKALGLRAHEKAVELACHIAGDVPDNLIGDAVRLRQVLVNLVGNAIKFTERGEVVVKVKRGDGPDDLPSATCHLQFSIKDTGIGIPEEKQTAIFGAFEQADTSTTRRFGGTGLGLAISSRLVELMGGTIGVDSTVGQGSTFAFTVRFGLAPETVPTPRARHATLLEGLPVLVVDDNATNRLILHEMLSQWGVAPRTATSGPEALQLLRQCRAEGKPVRLVLTDLHMPDMDGFMLAEQVRQDRNLAGTVIILLTSGGRSSDLVRGEQLDIAAQLMKPVKQSELLDAILDAVGERIDAYLHQPATLPEGLPHIRPLRILLAEDGLANQKLAVGLLRQWGHTVTLAVNGREAVEKLEQQPFDLVLMDVQMPEMDGLQATSLIRAREQRTGRHIPIVAITARAMKGDREQCLAAGMDGYVSKPIRQQELYHAIAPLFAPAAAPPARTEPPAACCPGDGPDWGQALKAVGGSRGLLQEVTAAVLQECPMLLEQLRGALARGEAATVQRTAHTLKGSLRLFHLPTIHDLAWALEQKGRSSHLDGAGELFAQLQAAYEKIEPPLAAFVKGDG